MGMMLIAVIVVIVGIAGYRYLRRRDGGSYPRPPWTVDEGTDEALYIARRRYAAGEITREEFERIRKDLELDRGGEL